MAHEFESQSFEPEEQAEIIRLAARLQAEHADRMTGRDLEVLAEEVGISPKFVRAAADKLGKKKTHERQRPELSPHGMKMMSAVFSLSQIIVIYNLMHLAVPIHPIGTSPMSVLALATALMLGVSKARANGGTGGLAGGIIGKSVFYALLCGAYVRLAFTQVNPDWWPTLPMLLLVQILVASFGYSLGSFAKEGSRHRVHAESP